MSLDLYLVSHQVAQMASRLRADKQERHHRLEVALETLETQSPRWRELEEKRQASKGRLAFSGPAGLIAGLGEAYDAPNPPSDYAVLASDGSHIDVDRNAPASCYLINIGTVKLEYGAHPQASLSNSPRLAFQEDRAIVAPQGSDQEPLQGAVLAAQRTVEECRALADLSQSTPTPALGLLDGSLILWGLAGQEYDGPRRFVRDALLSRGLVPALDELARREGLALASYISLPGAAEVVNTLRLGLCPLEPANCDRCRKERGVQECQAISGVLDRHLFGEWLEPGQRSALFLSPSRIVQDYYGPHRVAFFYLRLEEEVARVEVPLWVEERGLLGLVHSLLLEQCRLGMGYPVALSEAHEQAVLTTADREAFWALVSREMSGQGLEVGTSAKSLSKRRRWL
ncbi:MAG: DNA double-strand break repair nuclease NurA [Chloroflexi bacterium]|nr:DNA double-strand break repair nuclease NurA [Chloroflexota bacterium]